jgi:tRNA(Ile)-lysidine synthase
MAPVTVMNEISIIRPLLDTPKTGLLAYLKSRKQDYISDPSNENTAYDRIKIRKLMPQLSEVGLTPERLAKTARNMARAREFLQQETDNFLQHNCRFFSEGYAVLKTLPDSDEIALRVLARLMMIVGGHEAAPRLSELERLYASVKGREFKGVTLGGCIFRKEKGILIFREPASVKENALVTGSVVVWDNRFEIISRLPANRKFSVSALTQRDWLVLSEKHGIQNPCPDKKILYTLPAIRDAKGKVVAVPHLESDTQCRVRFIGIRH